MEIHYIWTIFVATNSLFFCKSVNSVLGKINSLDLSLYNKHRKGKKDVHLYIGACQKTDDKNARYTRYEWITFILGMGILGDMTLNILLISEIFTVYCIKWFILWIVKIRLLYIFIKSILYSKNGRLFVELLFLMIFFH